MAQPTTAEPLMTIPEVALLLRVSRAKVYNLINSGELTSVTITQAPGRRGCRRIRQRDYDQFITELGERQ